MAFDQGYDPTNDLEGFLRSDYDNFMKEDAPFQDRLLQQAMNDTSIVYRAREVAPMEIEKQNQIMQRNLERYGGGNLSPAQRKEFYSGTPHTAKAVGFGAPAPLPSRWRSLPRRIPALT